MLNPDRLGASEHTGPIFVTETVAEADLVESAEEVALTMPWPTAEAVNIPVLSTVPSAPVAVQMTPAVEPVTLAVNCWVPPTLSTVLPGVTATEIFPAGGPGGGPGGGTGGGGGATAFTVTLATADFVGSSTEVAVTVPVPAVTAVYCPLWSTVPTLVALHVIPLVELETLATNVCCCPAFNVIVVGEIVTAMVGEPRLPTR
jgi:hypothetical protein